MQTLIFNIFRRYHFFLSLHGVLAILFLNLPILATIHSLVVLPVGIYFVLKKNNPDTAICVISYILGCETLWRAFNATLIWEYSKYSIIIIIALAIFRLGPRKIKQKLGLLCIVLLLPSLFVMDELNRVSVSHALSGPFLIGLSMLIFSNYYVSRKQIISILKLFLLPNAGFALLAFYGTIAGDEISYHMVYTKKTTTAGLGANQVSNMLGLGSLFSFLLFNLDLKHNKLHLVMGFTFLIQAILTFSRGGVWTVLISLTVYLLIQIKNSTNKIKFIFSFLFISAILNFFILPEFDGFFKNDLKSRYSDFDNTQRNTLIEMELAIFGENPILGIGPGMSRQYRVNKFQNPKNNHTEYTRLLAEHGLLGLGIIFIYIIAIFKIFKIKNQFARGIALSLATWSMLVMFHSATRLAATSVIFGMATMNYRLGKR